ncbi:universal stress protein [Halomicroarcula sp. S1AR25-4]|uniref:universal stress protein n=1 Tax=Haloarcula sp. S1AR25-4 TaxID=2950538 RepID=UPI002876406E|nr:universal stress protein [Halomicroarcula sp. S1AR25-4]MDS0279833.1 universal stress protein [Halomicroarcula sp. S1AR25-4]
MTALVVVEDVDRDRSLLDSAREFAVGAETALAVVALATPEEYDEAASTLEAIGDAEHTSYDEGAVLEAVSGATADLAAEILGDTVEYEVSPLVEDERDQANAILGAAERTGCDHVFVPGYKRSPTGKAVFGDRTQQVLLNFDGYVTVSMD